MQLWFATALLAEGWRDQVRISIRDGAITAIACGVEVDAADEIQGVALPGLSNVHSHAFQRGMAGLAERAGTAEDNFWTWREIMYRFLDRLDPERMQAIAALAYAEMLESGFTRVGEFHYLHHDTNGAPYAERAIMAQAIAEASKVTGIGLTLLPVFYAHADFGGAPPVDGQRRFINDLDGFASILGEARDIVSQLSGGQIGVAPHSLRAATPEEIRYVVGLVDGAPIHIHVAEQMLEVEACMAWSGRRPVELLYDTVDVGAQWCLVHATHISPRELGMIANSGAVAGLCPVTEANLGDGIFPASDFLNAGGCFGIGTDSNVLLDAAEELRSMEYAQRLHYRRRNVLAGAPGQSVGAGLWRAAHGGGHRALKGAAAGLAVGAPADIVSLKADHPALIAAKGDQILDCWIFAGGRDLVDSVWRAGTKQVSHGKHHARDAIEADYRTAMRTLFD